MDAAHNHAGVSRRMCHRIDRRQSTQHHTPTLRSDRCPYEEKTPNADSAHCATAGYKGGCSSRTRRAKRWRTSADTAVLNILS